MQELKNNSLKGNLKHNQERYDVKFQAWDKCLTCLFSISRLNQVLSASLIAYRLHGLAFISHPHPPISPTRRLQCQSCRSTSLYNPEILLTLPFWTFGLLTTVSISPLSHFSSPSFLSTRMSSDLSCLLRTSPCISPLIMLFNLTTINFVLQHSQILTSLFLLNFIRFYCVKYPYPGFGTYFCSYLKFLFELLLLPTLL